MDTSGAYTVEECINYIGLGRFQWRLIGILGSSTMVDGIEMMLLSILGPALTCYWPDVTAVKVAILTIVVFCGMMVGGFLFGIIANKYGRRRVILASAIVNTVFGLLTAVAPNYCWLLIIAFFVGFALGGAAQRYKRKVEK